jgi:hypothetical protein
VAEGDVSVRTADGRPVTISVGRVRDEHVSLIVELAKNYVAELPAVSVEDAQLGAARLLYELIPRWERETRDAQRLHRCPRYEGNLRTCTLEPSGYGLTPPSDDPDDDGPQGAPWVSLTVPFDYSAAWVDAISWDIAHLTTTDDQPHLETP